MDLVGVQPWLCLLAVGRGPVLCLVILQISSVECVYGVGECVCVMGSVSVGSVSVG